MQHTTRIRRCEMYMAGSKRPNQVSGGGIWALKKEKKFIRAELAQQYANEVDR